MEYISLIVVIIGFLFSMFQKEEKKGSGKKTLKKKSVRTEPVSIPVNREKKIEQTRTTSANEYVDLADKAKREIAALKKESASLEKKIHMLNQQQKMQIEANYLSHKTPSDNGRGFIRKENMVDAVIFSEVLAPPRAKNPHRVYKGKNL